MQITYFKCDQCEKNIPEENPVAQAVWCERLDTIHPFIIANCHHKHFCGLDCMTKYLNELQKDKNKKY